MNRHPIHIAGSVNGVINMIYADVDGLVNLIMDEVCPEPTNQGGEPW